ncbi:unnamed protein product [Brassica oleracea]
MKQGDSTVREYNTLFLKSGLLEIHQQETLVMMYRDGLREEIRAELGVHVFSTIDDIMQAALDVKRVMNLMNQGTGRRRNPEAENVRCRMIPMALQPNLTNRGTGRRRKPEPEKISLRT